jgi:hypothetical protein
LRRLHRSVGPDFPRGLAGLDRRFLCVRVALLGRWHEARVNDLARHRQEALRPQQSIEQPHDVGQRPAVGQLVPKMPDGGLVRCRSPKVEACKAHPRQAVAQHELGPRVGQVVLRLQDQEFEHRDPVEGRTAAFGAVAIAEPCDQPAPERLEINRPLKGFKRVAAGADAGELLLKAEKTPLIRGKASTRATKPVNRNALGMGRFLRASSCLERLRRRLKRACMPLQAC